MPLPGGYWLRPSRMAVTATSRSSSGPSVSGKPWPRLIAPVAVASSDMVAKIVVVNGRRRRARYASPAATATIVPSGACAAYRLRRPCSASPITTCTAGWTGGASPTTTSPSSPRSTPTSSCSRSPGPPRGCPRARPSRRRRRSAIARSPTRSVGGGASGPSPAPTSTGSPNPPGPQRTARSTSRARAPSPRRSARSPATGTPSRARSTSPCWFGPTFPSKGRAWCP